MAQNSAHADAAPGALAPADARPAASPRVLPPDLGPIAPLLARCRAGFFWPLIALALAPALAAGLGVALLLQRGVSAGGAAVVAAAVLVLAAAGARQLRRRLARALRVVRRRAEALTLRHSGVLPPPVRDELGALASSFDAMTQALQDELARTRAALQAEVQNGVDLQRQYALMQLLRNLASLANEGESWPGALRAGLEEIGDYLDWPVGRLLLVEHGAGARDEALRSHWYATDPQRYAGFIEACERDGAGAGMAGRAVGSSLSHWFTDLARLEDWPARAEAQACGLRTGFVIPIAAAPGTTALIEFYTNHRIEASAEMLELVEAISAELWRSAQRREPVRASAAAPAPRMPADPAPAAGGGTAAQPAPVRTELLAVLGLDERQQELLRCLASLLPPLAAAPGAVPAAALAAAPTAVTLPVLAGAPGTAPEDEGPVLDLQVLAQVRGLERGAPGLLARLAEVYAPSSVQQLQAGEAALALGDAAALERSLHTLKSSSASLGALRLARRCARLGTLAQRGAFDEVRAAWRGLCAEHELALAALRGLAGLRLGAAALPGGAAP
jgi:HPt (histidine-containing phosphotransfer) domain-containing protein/HAMP domain-containing protein